MAVYFPSTIFADQATALPIPSDARRAIEQMIEQLIAMLDVMDGDCDLEDDELHDDAIDAFGEDPMISEVALVYRSDQSKGPININPMGVSCAA